MASGFKKMKKQARQLEEQLSKMQDGLKQKRVVGQAGGGLVEITLDGERAVKEVTIKRECVDPNDIEGLQDLIIGAFEDAAIKLGEELPSIPFGF
ncbi:MAG: YbaB/EbfC family nucleoid-associated protein [Simkaniaceae bacterium]|nr:YbaB/EbfC family nucleoid-associated protein [Simkaniaceae bacterium]